MTWDHSQYSIEDDHGTAMGEGMIWAVAHPRALDLAERLQRPVWVRGPEADDVVEVLPPPPWVRPAAQP